jgi:hypothetical protein
LKVLEADARKISKVMITRLAKKPEATEE